jgi:hypothetical protein
MVAAVDGVKSFKAHAVMFESGQPRTGAGGERIGERRGACSATGPA